MKNLNEIIGTIVGMKKYSYTNPKLISDIIHDAVLIEGSTSHKIGIVMHKEKYSLVDSKIIANIVHDMEEI